MPSGEVVKAWRPGLVVPDPLSRRSPAKSVRECKTKQTIEPNSAAAQPSLPPAAQTVSAAGVYAPFL